MEGAVKRLNVQDAFVGEPNPNQEGLAAAAEGDEAAIMEVQGGRLVAVVAPGTPDEQVFDSPQFIGLQLRLENGLTLDVGIHAGAEGVYVTPGAQSEGGRVTQSSEGLSSIWNAKD
jgi:hypothetical protein